MAANIKKGLVSTDGRVFALKIGPKGRVSDVHPIPSEMAPDPVQVEQWSEYVQNLVVRFPEEEIEPGDSWPDPGLSFMEESEIERELLVDHTLEKMDSKEIVVRTKLTFTQDGGQLEGSKPDVSGMFNPQQWQRNLENSEVKVTGEGTDKISSKDGLPISQSFELVFGFL